MRSPRSATYTYDCKDGSYIYGYANGSGGTCDSLDIKCGDDTIDSGKIIESYPIVFPMGNGQSDESSTVKITSSEKHKSGNFKLMVYALEKERFEEVYSSLADEQLEITDFSDRRIQGKLSVKEDGVLFLSIPYEKGWKVYIDGEKAETFKVLQAMLGVKAGSGDHDIRIEYTPEGFVPGVAVTFISAALVLLIAAAERRRKKRRRHEAALKREDENAGETSAYRQGAAIYDQLGIPRPEDHIGRVEDSETVLYDGRNNAEKEAGDAQSESNGGIQGN